MVTFRIVVAVLDGLLPLGWLVATPFPNERKARRCHDATNETGAARVVVWLDIRRKMPFYLQWLNIRVLYIAHRDASVRRIRAAATVPPA
jgi:hypothetical protein